MKHRSRSNIDILRVVVAFGLASLVAVSRARAEGVTLSTSSLREMTAQLSDGRVVSENLPVYPLGPRWYVPLGEVARGLGVAIEIVPEAATAEGYIKTETRTFKIDAKACRFMHEGKEETFDCGEAVVEEDDLFVTVELLEKILPLEVDVNSFRSEVTFTTRETFIAVPGAGRIRTGPFDPGYPKQATPSKRIDGFMIDSQLGYVNERNVDVRVKEVKHDSVLTGELLGMEASAYVSGRADQVTNQRFTLAKHDVDGGLPFGAREIQLLDVTFPTLPMIGAAGVFRGASLSSYPLQSASQFGTQDFIGDLQAGWEVELYQNDVLIDRRPSLSGRYEFKAIQLTYGVNRFRLAFYGPQGQRRERFETYSIDSSFLKPGEQSYRMSIANDIGAESRWLLQYDRSLMKNFNVYAAATRFSAIDVPNKMTYALLGARTYVDKLLLTTQAASSESGGVAWDNAVQAPFERASFGLGYTRLSNFFSEIYKIERGLIPRDVLKANVSFDVFAPLTVRLTFEASKTYYQDNSSNNLLVSRTSTRTGPVAWFNTFNYDQAGDPAFGELSTQTTLYGTEARSTIGYNVRAVNTANVELQKRITDFTTVGVGWLETFRQNLRKHSLLLTRQFSNVTLTANAALENQGNFALGALVSYSFGRDPREGQWWMQSKPQALLGAVSVFAFLDVNQNGQFDAGEPPLEGAEVVVNQQETGEKTGKTGIAVVTGLAVQEPADISLSALTLGGLQRRPYPRGVRILPRSGKTARVDLPIVVLSEIGGFVQMRGSFPPRPKRGVRLTLRNFSDNREVKSVFSDADGFYLLDEIRAGRYRVEIDALQLRGLRLKSERPFFEIEVGPEGLIDNARDFILDPASSGGVSK